MHTNIELCDTNFHKSGASRHISVFSRFESIGSSINHVVRDGVPENVRIGGRCMEGVLEADRREQNVLSTYVLSR